MILGINAAISNYVEYLFISSYSIVYLFHVISWHNPKLFIALLNIKLKFINVPFDKAVNCNLTSFDDFRQKIIRNYKNKKDKKQKQINKYNNKYVKKVYFWKVTVNHFGIQSNPFSVIEGS